MKRLFVLLSYAIMLVMVGACSKQEPDSIKQENTEGKDAKIYTLFASFDSATSSKTTMLDGKTPQWVVGDQIWLSIAGQAAPGAASSGVGEVTEIIDGVATIATSLAVSGKTVYAVYPYIEEKEDVPYPYSVVDKAGSEGKKMIKITVPSTQDGTFANAHICAAISSNGKLQFKNSITLLKVTSKQDNVTSFSLPNACGTIWIDPTGDLTSSSDFNVTPNEEVIEVIPSAETDAPYYIAVAPGTTYNSKDIMIKYNVGNQGVTFPKKYTADSPKILERSKVYNLGNIVAPKDVLPGVFSVSDTKKVAFSRGNLYCEKNAADDNWTWKTFDKQYEFVIYEGTNLNPPSMQAQYTMNGNENIKEYFAWHERTTDVKCTQEKGSDAFVDWGTMIDNNGTWTTLSQDEWNYLLCMVWPYSTASGSKRYGKSLCARAIVHQNNGLLIFPDEWKKEGMPKINYIFTTNSNPGGYYASNTISNEDWLILESSGVVFLPAIGMRTSATQINGINVYAYYWTSTKAYDLSFRCFGFKESDALCSPTNNMYDGLHALGVRLVTQVEL